MVSPDDVPTDDPRQVLPEVEGQKPIQRVMAVINYIEEDEATLEDVAERYVYTVGWLSRWLGRLERLANKPFEKVFYDERRSGKPSVLPEEQYDQFIEALRKSPKGVGLDVPTWSVPLARR